MNGGLGRVGARLAELGIDLTEVQTSPVARYEAVKFAGSLLFVSGHGPFLHGKPHVVGKVPTTISAEDARAAARLSALNCVSSIEHALSDLDRVVGIVRVFGMVNAESDFTGHASVIDGASEVLADIFGERGKHTRAAVGMGSLPFGIPVELEMVVEIES